MKRDELARFGIPAEQIRPFLNVYWADVKKQAIKMAEADLGATAPPSAIRAAINAMVRLIDGENHLAQILSNVNRHYAQYAEEKRKGAQDVPKD